MNEQISMFDDGPQPGEYELPDNAKRSACAGCQKPIAWVTTPTGAQCPVDVSTARKLGDGRVVALSHFKTCPHAKSFSHGAHKRARSSTL